MVIFTNEGRYIVRTNEGTIIKTENGNGFYLINHFGASDYAIVDINKYKWDKFLFMKIARKTIMFEQK